MMRNTKNLHCSTLLYFTFLSLLPILPTTASDTITATQSITINQTVVSSGNIFELGFFNPDNSQNWYVGIWYKNFPDKTVVWVANRDNPLTNSSSGVVLKIDKNSGNLVILDEAAANIIWTLSNVTKAATNPVAQLLDNGNFLIRESTDSDPNNYLWQSFDHPTDTLLPGMKLGWDLKTGLDRYITAWRSEDDPSTGDYSFKLDPRGFPEIYLWMGESIVYRSGPWNGLGFSGVPEMEPAYVFNFSFISNQDEVTYSFSLTNQSPISRLVVNSSGALQRFTWIADSKLWNLFWFAPKDQCDDYKECGVYGICDTNASPVCNCVKGFEPKNPQAWVLRDGSDGCVRKVKLDCLKDGFLELNNMKLPESESAFVDKNMSLKECENACRKNCSCTAYANSDIAGGGSGCVFWTSELVDMRAYEAGGQDLYVRLAASELEADNAKRIILIVGITVGIVILLCGLSICFVWKRRRMQRTRKGKPEQRVAVFNTGMHERSQDFLLTEAVIPSKRDYSNEAKSEDLELPLFDFGTLVVATDYFSDENKLGEGGFGCVHKGVLSEHQEIAVKRLSKNSGQGIEEFKNEVRLIARLQHRNLVRLLGCCIEMDEKMLIYEYMQNRSLDSTLFNKERSSLLDWRRRFNIICGIARGLLYLHQDSRFRIIHRDLKASNILLDGDMNPKISDFGMARIFGGDQLEASTRRVVGTYGYMAPEYAMDGLFSVKSDVFSFGVLVLEIISGKKNRGFYYANNELNLLGHAWRLWKEEKALELIDLSVGDSYSTGEVLRCIQVGLLCVQEHAEDRPTMSSVVLMLNSEPAALTKPKHPGFCLGRSPADATSSSSKQDESCTVNQVTVTMLDAR